MSTQRPERFYQGAIFGSFVANSVTAPNARGARKLFLECRDCGTRRELWSSNLAKLRCSVCNRDAKAEFKVRGVFYLVFQVSWSTKDLKASLIVPKAPPQPENFFLNEKVYEIDRYYAMTFMFDGMKPLEIEPGSYPIMPEGTTKIEVAVGPFLELTSIPGPAPLDAIYRKPTPDPRYPGWTIVPTMYLPFYLNVNIHDSLVDGAIAYLDERIKAHSEQIMSNFTDGGTRIWKDEFGNEVAYLYLEDTHSEILSREGPTAFI